MGQACSGARVGRQIAADRDPDDMELDWIEMQRTNLPEFDGTFDRASGPLNELVDVHNSLFSSGENLKQAGAALQGATQVRILLDQAGRVNLFLWHFAADGSEVMLREDEVNALLCGSGELSEAYGILLTSLAGLNESFRHLEYERTVLQVKHGRLLIQQSGDQDLHALTLNRTLFTFRKHLAAHAHVSSLKQATQVFLQEVASVNDVRGLGLRVHQTDSGKFQIVSGDHIVDFAQMKNLSNPGRYFALALNELLVNVDHATKSMPELVDTTNALLAEAQQFPAQMNGAVANSPLSVTDIPKASAATSFNIKALSNGPRIASAAFGMVQFAAREIAEAIAQPVVGA